MRAVFESLGVADVVTKSVGTSNPYNMIRAPFSALGEQTSPKSVAQRRGKKVAHLLRRGGASAAVRTADAEAVGESEKMDVGHGACREREGQYVANSVGAVQMKK